MFCLVQKFLSEGLCRYLIEKSPHQSKQETLMQAEECLRYLYLAHLTKGSIPVTQKIDDIWHLLILQTKEYFDLCLSLPAKRYIHHCSDIYAKYSGENTLENKSAEAKRQIEWMVSYVNHFGDMTEDNLKYWTFAQALCSKLNLSLEKFNEELKNISSNSL